MRTAVCLVAAVACGAVGAQGHVVGVFDCQAVGGSGTSTDGFMGVFDGLEGYDAQVLTDLDMSALYGCDVVILYDTHEPGNVVANWVGNLTQFVQAGGSVLQIYHHHQFGSVGTGVLKVRVPEVRPVGDGPLVEGISQWTTDWPDHIILAKGPQATTFIESTESKPVAARGVIGKGKLISCGIALGVKQDWRTSKAPTGMELKLLENMLDWLKPEERWPARMANYAASAELVTWVGTKYVRQPAPVMVRLKGVVERASERGTVDLTVTDSAGKQSTSQAVWVAKSVEGADVGLVDETIEVATSGLAFGVAQVRRVLRVAGQIIDAESPTTLVRAEVPETEFRAFWTHAFDDRLPEEIMPRIQACGFNAVVPRISGGTGAFYLSKALPDVQNALGEEDWLENCIKHAHANGIEVHPYRNCWVMEGRAGRETIAAFREAGRLQVGPKGEPIDWMCPSQEINRQVELAAATEVVRDYDVDGFQFDFIRYPSSSGCFCGTCRDKFEAEQGAKVEDWPTDVRAKGKLFGEYTAFRQTQITETVVMVSEAIREIKPDVRISAAVFRDYAKDSVSVGQDWVTWCEAGYIDFLCPMDYTEDLGKLDGWVRDQVALVGEHVPVYAGLGLAASTSRMDSPGTMALQIDIARQAGAKGFVLFAWGPGCDEEIVLPQRDDCLKGTPTTGRNAR